MTEIQIAVEGPAAIQATEALLALPEITGSFETQGDVEREGTLATIATIVGLVGGGMAIAEQLRKWHGEYQMSQQGEARIEKVLIVTPRGRLLLENATTDEIAKALEPFTHAPESSPN